ncbi:MAG: EAL domain-containing protein [Sphingomonas bacterium]|nr:EAL domain-containing protein [Sphingomonas bacterium]
MSLIMLKWRNLFGGNRSSDRPQAVAAQPRRDRSLEAALARDEIQVLFQPQIEPATGRIAGVEALARWTGAANPEALFERAEAAGLSERLSRTIQRKALRIVGRWSGALATLNLSINLLPRDLDRRGFDAWFLAEIAAAGLDPRRITAEIVESALLQDRPAVARRLARLRAQGVRIAVDDFGTGYANLAYLTSLPLDAIKIDRALVADMVGRSRDRIVVKAMLSMARELDLKVVVEGVESLAQLELLAEWGCDLYQGFVGAGALDESELSRFVLASHRLAA